MKDALSLWLGLLTTLPRQEILACVPAERRLAVEQELRSLNVPEALDQWLAARRRALRPVWIASRDRLHAVPARLHPLLWPLLAEMTVNFDLAPSGRGTPPGSKP